MRKIILGIVIIVFVLSAMLLIQGMINKVKKHKQITEKIATLPSFSFTTLTNETFNSSEIAKGPVLIIRFHPECENCQYEISEILKSNIPGSGIRIVMVSSAGHDAISKFFSQFDLSAYPSIILLVDPTSLFGDIFGKDIVPSIYIYNKELHLVKVLYGEVKTETILKYLNQSE
jgi:thiol-disulfide isomerase/thioredoxin